MAEKWVLITSMVLSLLAFILLLIYATVMSGCAASTIEPSLVWERAEMRVQADPDLSLGRPGVMGVIKADLAIAGASVGLVFQGSTGSGAVAMCAQMARLPPVCAKFADGAAAGSVLLPLVALGSK